MKKPPTLIDLQVDARLKEGFVRWAVDSPFSLLAIAATLLGVGLTLAFDQRALGPRLLVGAMLVVALSGVAIACGPMSIRKWIEAENRVADAKVTGREEPGDSRHLEASATRSSRVRPSIGTVVLVAVIVGLLARRSPRG